jgi:hypothetical protein
MAQTFADLCREHAAGKDGTFTFLLWTFGDTCLHILRAHLSILFTLHTMQKRILRLAVGTALFLLIPLALTIRDGNVKGVGWNWSPGDFVFAFVMIFGTGLAYQLVSRKAGSNILYKVAMGLGLAGAFLLIWVNAAVGIIGGENNPINMLFVLVPLIGIIGAMVARLRPQGMSVAMLMMTAAQLLIPAIAFLIAKPSVGTPEEVFGVVRTVGASGFFALFFLGSALLFRKAALAKARPIAGLVR